MATVQINPHKLLGTTRYNGGWIKRVTALDETHNNGYSLVGDFMRESGLDNYTVGGLYLDCGIGRSRNKHWREYTLFTVGADGSCTRLASAEESRDWAMQLWPAVRAYFAAQADPPNPLADYTVEQLLAEVARREMMV